MKSLLETLQSSEIPDVSLLTQLLAAQNDESRLLRDAASDCMGAHVGNRVYFRGLLEVTNRCIQNCHYCGIRKDASVTRYRLGEAELLAAAVQCNRLGFGSMVLQSGELPSDDYVDFICRMVARIRRDTRSDVLPDGLGITLSIGVLSRGQYQKLFDAGAHRYLLRIETSNPDLFAALHPATQTLDERFKAISVLQDIGFQTGTGVMIGLPGQTLEMLANDILTFQRLDIDMVGMGPYLPAQNTPMAAAPIPPPAERLRLGLNMIALTRLVCRDINIASTTALEALHPQGRLLGLQHGANVAMPNFTPSTDRIHYTLYDGKPMAQTAAAAVAAVETIGRSVALNDFGDSKHFFSRRR